MDDDPRYEDSLVMPVRKGPALLVLAIVLFIAGGGAALALTLGGHPESSSTALRSLGTCRVGGRPSVDIVSADGALRDMQSPLTVPNNVAAALFVPEGSKVLRTIDRDREDGQLDREVDLSVPRSAQTVMGCFKTELPELGWTVSSEQPSGSASSLPGEQVIAQHNGQDGYLWELGVTVAANSPLLSPALSGASDSTSSSLLKLRLLQVPDES